MNKYINVSIAIIVALFFSLPMINTVQAVSVDEAVSKIVDTVVKKASSSSDFTSKLCKKANFFSGVFSIRSAEGIACNNKYVAALAEVMCTTANTDNYADSHCHKNAVKALGSENAIDVLKKGVAAKAGQATQLICSKTGNLPPALKTAAQACPKA